MAVLDTEDRRRVGNHFMRVAGTLIGIAFGFLKTDLRSAVDATDQWIEDNQTAYNSALPVAFRTSATLAQKTLLFCFVAMRRANVLRAEED